MLGLSYIPLVARAARVQKSKLRKDESFFSPKTTINWFIHDTDVGYFSGLTARIVGSLRLVGHPLTFF